MLTTYAGRAALYFCNCLINNYLSSNLVSYRDIQGDHSPWRKPPVDIDVKVAF